MVPKNPANAGNLRRIEAGRSSGMERNPVHRQLATIPAQGAIFRSNKKFLKHASLWIGSHEMPRLVGTPAPTPFRKWLNATHRGMAGGFKNDACSTFRRQHSRATCTQGTAFGILRHTSATAHGGSQNWRNRSVGSHGNDRIEDSGGNK
jgi:hypothetical protein